MKKIIQKSKTFKKCQRKIEKYIFKIEGIKNNW